jgi:hypothetical protein
LFTPASLNSLLALLDQNFVQTLPSFAIALTTAEDTANFMQSLRS